MSLPQQVDIRNFARSLGLILTYRPGDVIFREGDEPRYMYVVLHGTVQISSHGKPIETILEGNALGVISLLDGMPRSATASALSDIEVAILDQKKFRYMVEEVPNFVWYIMGELVHRLRTTNAAL